MEIYKANRLCISLHRAFQLPAVWLQGSAHIAHSRASGLRSFARR